MTTDTIKAALEAIRERADVATAGPWQKEYDNDTGPNDEGYWEFWKAGPVECTREVDADFVSSARTDVPKLAQALEEALKGVECRLMCGRFSVPGQGLEHCSCGAQKKLARITSILEGKP